MMNPWNARHYNLTNAQALLKRTSAVPSETRDPRTEPGGMDLELAGDRAVTEISAEGTMTVTFSDKGTGRTCGSGTSRCQLCCTLLPIPTIRKPANQRCQHQSGAKGCKIYAERPFPCKTFSCRWLADVSTKGLPRPDRAHYVIDIQPDHIQMTDEATGETRRVNAFQVWVDPAFPDAHRAAGLRAWMHEMARLHGAATIVRWSPVKGIAVFPPPFDPDGEWRERTGVFHPQNAEERDIANGFEMEVTTHE